MSEGGAWQPIACLTFLFNEPATTEIYTLSLHDALPILELPPQSNPVKSKPGAVRPPPDGPAPRAAASARFSEYWPKRSRSEEHTSELQSRQYLVCRLLLEKKNLREHAADQSRSVTAALA